MSLRFTSEWPAWPASPFPSSSRRPTLGCELRHSGALLPPATKLGQGNIFSSVCQEFCPRGGEYLGRCPPAGTPPPPHQILRDTINERAVRILLECILVQSIIMTFTFFGKIELPTISFDLIKSHSY